ncbi:MAG: hydroxymyristoyl-ACP dehydratase [Leeuwenhoekiella sp.]
MEKEEIISKLPYKKPFLFVDEITKVSETGISGNYTFPEDSFFYKGHFVNFPVTPGVILTECMAQIGLVCLGIYLLSIKSVDLKKDTLVAMTESNVHFYAPVYPNEKVFVESQLQYFRFNKLKCKIKLINEKGNQVCSGILSGMLVEGHAK